MNRLTLLACLALAAVPAVRAEEQLRYLIQPDKFEQPSAKTKAALLAALCDGKVENGACDTCPQSELPGGGFSLNQVIMGHFKQPTSDDAMVTLSGCEQMHATIAWGYLLTRVDGEWQAAGEMLGLDLDHCHKMKFRSGRELLVCEDYRMESFELMHTVAAIFDGKDADGGDALHVRGLLTTTDTTQLCDKQTLVRKGQIDKVEFRDLNGDGIEDVSFMASLGTMADSKRRQEICEAAQPYKSRVRRLEPKATKSYKMEYLFDGRQFKLTKESEAAAKVFRPEE